MERSRWEELMISFTILISSVFLGFCIVNAAKIISKAIISQESAAPRRQMPDRAARDLKGPSGIAAKPGSQRVKGVSAAGNAVKGNPKAKLLLVEFSDFQCPFSKRFYQESFPQIEKEYIAKGKVKFVFRDFPLAFHPQAKPAAIACECAGKQGKYWQMFDKLLSVKSLEADSLKGLAKDIGLNTATFNKCLDNQETKGAVENDINEAAKFGVKATPSFFINGRLVEGALPFTAFKEIIEEELKSGR